VLKYFVADLFLPPLRLRWKLRITTNVRANAFARCSNASFLVSMLSPCSCSIPPSYPKCQYCLLCLNPVSFNDKTISMVSSHNIFTPFFGRLALALIIALRLRLARRISESHLTPGMMMINPHYSPVQGHAMREETYGSMNLSCTSFRFP
jgi:hypothetical protein